MSLWIIIVALLIAGAAVGVVGFQKNSGVMMIASGAWALFFMSCGFKVGFDDASSCSSSPSSEPSA